MRTLLTGELTTALSWSADYYLKLEIQNGSGTWIDVGSYFSCVVNAQWGEHINDPVSRATFTLIRNKGTTSFAPFLSTSSVNVDDAALYSPLLEIGRGVRASTATMGAGAALDAGKYRQVFIGRIDRVRQTDNGRDSTPIVIECSDLGAWLMDMQIHDGEKEYGTEDGGSPLEDVLQEILNDKIPSGEPAVTLVKSSSSQFAVVNQKVGEEKVLSVLTNLVLDSVGEDLRYRYNSSHVSALTWFDPDRGRATIDQTLTTYNLRRLDTAIDDIRNSGELPYTDATTGTTGVASSINTASIAKYRERFQRMEASPLLTDPPSAKATIDAVINDLSGPMADFEAQCPYLWFVQLFDRYTFPADNRTYNADQTLGVIGFQHTIENGHGETVIQCADRVVGAYAAWLKRIPGEQAQGEIILTVIAETTTQRIYQVTRGLDVNSVWMAAVEFDSPLSTLPWDEVAAKVTRLGGDTFTVMRPTGKRVTLIQVEPRDASLSVCGRVWQATLEASPPQLPAIEVAYTETDTTGTGFAALQNRGETLVTVQVRTKSAGGLLSSWTTPLRTAGSYSKAKQRTLAADEYEHDVLKDPKRVTTMQFRAIISGSGEIITTDPMIFDWNTTPDITFASGEGSIARLIGDSDTKSVRFQHKGGTWEYWTGGAFATVDVSTTTGNGSSGSQAPMPAGATWTITATAYSESKSFVTSSTPKDTATFVVTTTANNGGAPDITFASGVGYVAWLIGDADTKSVRFQQSGGTWDYWTDGRYAAIDVTATTGNGASGSQAPMPTGETWTITATAYAAAKSQVTSSTLKTTATFTVSESAGGSGGGGPTGALAIWKAVNVSAPALSTRVVPIQLQSDTGGTLKARVYARYNDGSGFTELTDITSSLSPALSTPPTTLTSYTWSGLDMKYNATAPTNANRMELEIVAQIQDGITTVAAETRTVIWYYGTYAPTTVSEWETVNVAAPGVGSKTLSISLDATAAAGTVELLYRRNDGYGWTTATDIAALVSPSVTTPPIASTSYTYLIPNNGLTDYTRTATGTPVTVEIVANIKEGGVVQSTRTESVSWLYTDTKITPPEWETVSLAAPALGSKVMSITLDATPSTVPNTTVELLYRRDDGYGWTTPVNIASSVTPTLSTPPASSTAYSYSVPNFGIVNYTRTTPGTGTITVEVVANIKVGGVIQSTQTETVSWAYDDPRI